MTDTPRPRRALEPLDDEELTSIEQTLDPVRGDGAKAPRSAGPWLQVLGGALFVGLIAFLGVWAVRTNNAAELKAGECVTMEGGDAGASHRPVDCAATDKGLIWKVTEVGKDENGCEEEVPYITRDSRTREIKSVACLLPLYRDGVCYDESADLPVETTCTPGDGTVTVFKVAKHVDSPDADCADVEEAAAINYTRQNLTYCTVPVGD